MAGIVVAVIALTTMFVGTASAHDFSGKGECDAAHGPEWILTLDGTYGAHTILIDGVAQSTVKTSYHIPDASSDTVRSFTVKWDKSSGDVTKTHTVTRDPYPCGPPPDTITTFSEWEDGTYECGDRTVVQTRVKRVILFLLIGAIWQEQPAVVTTETRIRELTADEIEECDTPDTPDTPDEPDDIGTPVQVVKPDPVPLEPSFTG